MPVSRGYEKYFIINKINELTNDDNDKHKIANHAKGNLSKLLSYRTSNTTNDANMNMIENAFRATRCMGIIF